MQIEIKIAILIPVHNGIEYTKKCLKSINEDLINQHVRKNYEIILIDDGSVDGTSDWVLNRHKDVVILKGDGNLWWSGGINTGAYHAIEKLKCTHLLLWNNDIISSEGYFKEVVACCNKYGNKVILGSKIYSKLDKDKIWSYGGKFDPVWGKFGMIGYLKDESDEYKTPMEVDWLTGMGTIVPTGVIQEIGYWNDKDFPQYHGDTEFTYRAYLAGFKNIVIPELKLWNDISNSGIKRKESIKDIKHLLTDKRSLLNFSVNYKFLSLYSKNPLAYMYLVKMYFYFLGGFIKRKIFRGAK